MIPASVEPRPWSALRWWSAMAVVVAAQIALVFWLEDRSPMLPRRPSAAPAFRIGDHRMGELLAIQNPTLFALPQARGFSGEAWLKIPSLGFLPADWSEPARFLPADVRELGLFLRNFVQTNPSPSRVTIDLPHPAWTVPGNFSVAPPPVGSRLRVEGDLAKRRWLSPPQLPTWTNSDLLANSIVQLLVDAQGNPVSGVLLRPDNTPTVILRPGTTPTAKQDEADQYALKLARTARFEPAQSGTPADSRNPSAGLSIGTLIFEWQTMPASSSDALPGVP